jgi:hypothetical protein
MPAEQPTAPLSALLARLAEQGGPRTAAWSVALLDGEGAGAGQAPAQKAAVVVGEVE